MLTELTRTEDVIEAKYDSSNIISSRFEIKTSTLYVTFVKGGLVYKYENVNPADYFDFQDSESTGKEFVKKIKDKYTGEKV